MADAFNFGSPGGAAPYAGGGGYAQPAAAPTVPSRHPLGLPRGSVRAVMIVMILGTIITLLVMPLDKKVSVPIYMYYLLFLTTGAYFSGRGAAPPKKVSRDAAPLGLPRGSIRFLLIVGFLGAIGWTIYQAASEEKFNEFFNRVVVMPALPEGTTVLDKIAVLTPLIMLGAFFLGSIVETIAKMILAGDEGLPGWYQDIQAWLAIVAVLALGAEVILQIVVFPSMEEDKRINLPQFQTFLAAIVAFYFGARS